MCRLRLEAGSRPCRAVGSLSRQSRHLGFWRLTAQASYFLSLSRGSGRRLWVVYKSNYYHYFKHFFHHFLRFFYMFLNNLFTSLHLFVHWQSRRLAPLLTTNDDFDRRLRQSMDTTTSPLYWSVRRVRRTTTAQDTSNDVSWAQTTRLALFGPLVRLFFNSRVVFILMIVL
jgi:hypothetical protein